MAHYVLTFWARGGAVDGVRGAGPKGHILGETVRCADALVRGYWEVRRAYRENVGVAARNHVPPDAVEYKYAGPPRDRKVILERLARGVRIEKL